MTRPSSYIALVLVLSAALAACREHTNATEPAMAPVVAQSVGDAAPITDQTQLAELRQVTARFHSLESAKAAGYLTEITPCWAHHSAGAMGYQRYA